MLKKWRLSPIFQMGCQPRAFAILVLPKRCRPLFPDFASLIGASFKSPPGGVAKHAVTTCWINRYRICFVGTSSHFKT
jgi:hypothetical protein